jgi:hypothetical protein
LLVLSAAAAASIRPAPIPMVKINSSVFFIVLCNVTIQR